MSSRRNPEACAETGSSCALEAPPCALLGHSKCKDLRKQRVKCMERWAEGWREGCMDDRWTEIWVDREMSSQMYKMMVGWIYGHKELGARIQGVLQN